MAKIWIVYCAIEILRFSVSLSDFFFESEMKVKEREGSKEEEIEMEDESSVKEREEETKKEGDFFRRCRVRVIGLRSGKGSFAKRSCSLFVGAKPKKSFRQVFH